MLYPDAGNLKHEFSKSTKQINTTDFTKGQKGYENIRKKRSIIDNVNRQKIQMTQNEMKTANDSKRKSTTIN